MSYTIAQQGGGFFQKIKPWLVYLLLFAAMGGIAYGVSLGMHEMPGIRGENTLTVKTLRDGAVVNFEDEELGRTPLEEIPMPKRAGRVRIEDPDNPARYYEVNLEAEPGTSSLIYRDLGVSSLFSSGRELWLEKARTGLTVISQPSGATVYLDGVDMGKTPLSLEELTEGGYDLELRALDYEEQSLRINVSSGYRLNVSTQLFPVPIPPDADRFEESEVLWNLTINNELIANAPERAKATNYWMTTRSVELGQEGITDFDYYIDYKGNLFDGVGSMVVLAPELVIEDAVNIGYLGFDTTLPGLTPEARETYLEIFESQTATILETGTGWLRVRENPSLGASEVGRVDVGRTYAVLETRPGWVKIRVSTEIEGWVSADFVRLSQ